MKFVCFEEETKSTNQWGEIIVTTQNVYKGEGTIQFTCYFPFGYGEDEPEDWHNMGIQNQTINTVLKIGGDLPTTFEFSGEGVIGEIQIGTLKITPSLSSFVWNSKTGLVTNDNIPINYTGTSYGTIGPNNITINFTLKPKGTATFTRKPLYY